MDNNEVDLTNAGPNYGQSIASGPEPSPVPDFATEVKMAVNTVDTNGDGMVSVNEELEYMDDQGQTISKNLKKLTTRQTLAVEKDINKRVNKGDAYGAVMSFQKWRDKMLSEAFGRHIGDRNST